MEKAMDPVCGMEVDATPALSATYESHVFYFCSEECRGKFQADPERYFEPEKHEPPYTVTDKMVAPKFGAAGSGGLENEPVPERHVRK